MSNLGRAGAWMAVALCVTACGRERVAPEEVEAAVSEQAPQVGLLDHRVPHVSTAPVNAGERVELFVRERYPLNRPSRGAVLMIHGRSTPVLAVMDLQRGHYSWAEWLAGAGGFDVFMLDFQGSGRSPRGVLDDPCNASTDQQLGLLIPNPLAATCPRTYGFQPFTTGSDRAELDTVVDYIRALRGVDKVHLVSYSQASFRVGPYAVDHPEKVASVIFFAPIFNTAFAPTNPPALPGAGPVMFVRTRAETFQAGVNPANNRVTGWYPELRCPDQREPDIEDTVWAAIRENDDQTWGPTPEGVTRFRDATLWGWNASVAANLAVPTLIIQGQHDVGQGGFQQLPQLYDLVQTDNKLRLRVQCSGHFMMWERQAKVLHHVSKAWLGHGEVGGFTQGEFFVDGEGNLSPCVRTHAANGSVLAACAGE